MASPRHTRTLVAQRCDSEFLRFIEQSDPKRDRALVIESRSAAADRVVVRVDGRSIALGTRAVSKLLVGHPASAALMRRVTI